MLCVCVCYIKINMEDLGALLAEFAQKDAEEARVRDAEAASKPELTKGEQKEKDAKERAAKGMSEARRVELRRQLNEARRMRGGAPSKAAYLRQKEEAEKREKEMLAKAKKRQETMTKDEAMKNDIVASHRMHREDQAIRTEFVRKLTRYAWESIRSTLVTPHEESDTVNTTTHTVAGGLVYPKQFAYRMRYVMMSDAILEETFVDTLIISFSGHVHGFSTDDFDGLKGFIEKQGGDVQCVPQSLLEDLPGCGHKKSADHITTINGLDAEKLPTLTPPWWDVPQVPDTLVLREVLTADDASAEWPTTADALGFQREVRERWAYVNENLETWRKKFEEKMEKQEMQKKASRAQAPRNVVRDASRRMREEKRVDASDVIV